MVRRAVLGTPENSIPTAHGAYGVLDIGKNSTSPVSNADEPPFKFSGRERDGRAEVTGPSIAGCPEHASFTGLSSRTRRAECGCRRGQGLETTNLRHGSIPHH